MMPFVMIALLLLATVGLLLGIGGAAAFYFGAERVRRWFA